MNKRASPCLSGEEHPASIEQASHDTVELTEVDMEKIAVKAFEAFWKARDQRSQQEDPEILKMTAKLYRRVADMLEKRDF